MYRALGQKQEQVIPSHNADPLTEKEMEKVPRADLMPDLQQKAANLGQLYW